MVSVFVAILAVLKGLNEIINLAEKALINIKDDNDKKFNEKEIPKSALNQVRKQIKQEIELKNSQFIYEQRQREKEEKEKRKNLKDGDEFVKISASQQVIEILTDSINLSAIELEELTKQISSEQLDTINLVKLKRAQRSMRYTLVFLCFACVVTGYDLLEYLITTNINIKMPLNVSPYPTPFAYIGHLLYDFTADLLLILSVYKRSDCCTTIAANSFMFICCPILDCDGKSEEYLNQVNKTIDINGNPLKKPIDIDVDKIDIYADSKDQKIVNEEEEETQIQSKTTTNTLIANQPPLSQHASVTASTQLELPSTRISRVASLNDDGILIIIYNLENALLSIDKDLNDNEIDENEDEEMIAIKSLTFEQASKAFGGKDGITLLKVHFDSMIAMDIKLFVISKRSSQIVETVLNKCGLLQYFQNDDDPIITDRVIGNDHQLFWTKTNHQYSLNEKLLKIIEKCQCVNDSILYIDADDITINVERINLCRVYGVKNKGLQLDDFKAIQKKYFTPI